MTSRLRVGILATHPVQYYAPWYRALARSVDLDVFFSQRQTAAGQAAAGFGVEFDWDASMFDGYRHTFLRNVARAPSVDTFHGCNTPEIAGLIRRARFDAFIVHGWYTRSFWQAMIACWRARTPLLVRGDSILTTPRSAWWRAAKRPLFRRFIPRFDGYLVVGRRAQEYLEHFGADPAKCFPSPHSVDNSFFAERAAVEREHRAELRGTMGLSSDSVVFLFAGKFTPVKAPLLFVEAVARAAAESSNVEGLMAGDGPLRRDAEALAASLNAPVRFAGFLNQSQMPRAYAAADVIVLCSTNETWGLVVNEAMASGLPVIVSDGVGCGGDLVLHGETGALFPAGDVDALAREMRRFTDSTYRARLSANALAKVADFDVARSAALTVEALRRVARS